MKRLAKLSDIAVCLKCEGNEQNLQLQTWLSKRTNTHKLINDAVANIKAVEKGMLKVGRINDL